MANPFHDETGKFCSKGEMQTAIQNLARSGDLEGYFKLRQEFEAIEGNKVVVSANLIDPLARLDQSDAQDIRGLYGSIQGKLTDDGTQEAAFVNLLVNPNTPEDIRNEILTNASPALKERILSKLERRSIYRADIPLTSVDYMRMTEGETSNELFSALMESKNFNLTVEDKYNIAKKYPRGLADLAWIHPQAVFGEPSLHEEFNDQRKNLEEAEDLKNVSPYYLAMAESSSSPEDHEVIINSNRPFWKGYNSAYVRLAGNSHLSSKNASKLLRAAIYSDISHSRMVVRGLAENFSARYDNSAYVPQERAEPVPLKSEVPESLAKSLATVKAQYEENEASTAENRIAYGSYYASRVESYQAAVDAHAANYEALMKEYRIQDKEARRKNRKKDLLDFNALNDFNALKERIRNANAFLNANSYVNQLNRIAGVE